MLRVGLPYYAAIQIGGMRVGLVLLVALGSNLACSDKHSKSFFAQLAARPATLTALALCIVGDVFGLTVYADTSHLVTGYLALIISIFAINPPLAANASSTSPLTATPSDTSSTLYAGVALSILTIASSIIFSVAPSVTPLAITFSTSAMAITAALVLFARPAQLRTQKKAGLALGCLLAAASSVLFSPNVWPGTFCNGAVAALSYVGVLYDASNPHSHTHDTSHTHTHANAHNHCNHHHGHQAHAHAETSIFTSFLLARCRPDSLLHSILCDRDSRRIAYFTCLNFAFMLVQAFYGWVSGSLGLLSDTVHMFFDCLALVIGLGAAVASKWPTSPEMPFGWGKLNVLAGFGNGIFLMLVSVEFIWEAVEGIMEGSELRHVEELLIVSTLGFLVNMVGLFAFGHAHHGHDHGGHDHSHGHGNENMHGIYLHVAADAGGSLAVILSTILTLWKPWYLWDPLATIVIALLIFAAAVPLVRDSGNKLLLVIPGEMEYGLKGVLQELSGLRGVTGYAVPRFWVEEEAGDGHEHDDHDHSHEHEHHHDHIHDHHHHDHHEHEHEEKKKKMSGVIHVFAAPAADTEDVRDRVVQYFKSMNMNVVVQVERDGEGRCWCGGGAKMG
jgi:zinc transporter 5/7